MQICMALKPGPYILCNFRHYQTFRLMAQAVKQQPFNSESPGLVTSNDLLFKFSPLPNKRNCCCDKSNKKKEISETACLVSYNLNAPILA